MVNYLLAMLVGLWKVINDYKQSFCASVQQNMSRYIKEHKLLDLLVQISVFFALKNKNKNKKQRKSAYKNAFFCAQKAPDTCDLRIITAQHQNSKEKQIKKDH